MYYYRITKYNPIFRDGFRYTKDDEWTSVSDIGNPKYGYLTASEYLQMEDKYWDTIKYLLDLCSIKYFNIRSLEKRIHRIPSIFSEKNYFDSSSLENAIKYDLPINILDIELVVRLCLREDGIWCKLEGEKNTCIHFGYDYYMYFSTSIEHTIVPSIIPDGIYIENFESPYLGSSASNLWGEIGREFNISTIIELVQRDPTKYLHKLSIVEFSIFLRAYSFTVLKLELCNLPFKQMQSFSELLCSHYKIEEPLEWNEVLLKVTGDEESALELFWKKWDDLFDEIENYVPLRLSNILKIV
jgi:hypothetical protein